VLPRLEITGQLLDGANELAEEGKGDRAVLRLCWFMDIIYPYYKLPKTRIRRNLGVYIIFTPYFTD
jgi:hypothetical protein